MGANTDYRTYPGTLTKEEVIARFHVSQSEDGIENGGTYSGTISRLPGVEVTDHVFESQKAAESWIEKNHEKWEPAYAVRYQDLHLEPTREPTFGGEPAGKRRFVYARNYQSKCCLLVLRGEDSVEILGSDILVPDQLPEAQQSRLKKLAETWLDLDREDRELESEFGGLLKQLGNWDVDFPTESWAQLKRVRRLARKTNRELLKIHGRFVKLDMRYSKKVWKYKTVKKGTRWLVGGWCPS